MRSRKYWNMWKNQHRCLVKRVCVLLTSHFLPLIFCEQKIWGKKATFWCACFAPFTSISKTSETAPKWTWFQIFSSPFFFGDKKQQMGSKGFWNVSQFAHLARKTSHKANIGWSPPIWIFALLDSRVHVLLGTKGHPLSWEHFYWKEKFPTN